MEKFQTVIFLKVYMITIWNFQELLKSEKWSNEVSSNLVTSWFRSFVELIWNDPLLFFIIFSKTRCIWSKIWFWPSQYVSDFCSLFSQNVSIISTFNLSWAAVISANIFASSSFFFSFFFNVSFHLDLTSTCSTYNLASVALYSRSLILPFENQLEILEQMEWF